MKVDIPKLKAIPGLPTIGEQIEAMSIEELEELAQGCTPHEIAAIEALTAEQLKAAVHGTAEGMRIMAEIAATAPSP